MKKIVFTKPLGGIGIITPGPEWTGTLDELAQKTIPNTPYYIIDEVDLPKDRTFRDAWRKTGLQVKEDLVESRKIALQKEPTKAVEIAQAKDITELKALLGI